MKNTTNNSFIQQLESKDAQNRKTNKICVYIFWMCLQLNSTDKTCQSINAQKLRHWLTYAFDFEQNHTVESLCMFLYASVNSPLWYNGFCCISFGF